MSDTASNMDKPHYVPLSKRSQSKWSRINRQEFTSTDISRGRQEQLKRRTFSAFGKLTFDNADKLLPQIYDIYDNVDDLEMLKSFLSVIIQRAIISIADHALFLYILSQLIQKKHKHVTTEQFKQTVAMLCDARFNESLTKSLRTNYRLRSTCQFLGKLISSPFAFVEYEAVAKYLQALLVVDDIGRYKETMLDASCQMLVEVGAALFTSKLNPLLNHATSTYKIVTADSSVVYIGQQSYYLIHGFIRQEALSAVSVEVANICVGYYDVNWYIVQCFELLEKISSYSLRIRFMIQDMLQQTHWSIT